MVRKRSPDWADIESRYINQGESPASIARDYDVNPRTISWRAATNGWLNKRKQTQANRLKCAAETREITFDLAGKIRLAHLQAMHDEIQQRGAYVMDGEGFICKAHLESYKTALSALDKAQDGSDTTEPHDASLITPADNIDEIKRILAG
jgi:transposase-like protein